MSKVVVLKLDGDLTIGGFRVSLEILNGNYREREIRGNLPPNPKLAEAMDWHWQEYRSLDIPKRIKPKSIQHNTSPTSGIKSVQESGNNLNFQINQWLNSDGFRHINMGLREELSLSEKVRVLICTEDDYLRKLPWHLWDFVQRYAFAEVAISPIEYKKPKPKPSAKISTQAQVRILAILGSSTGINIDTDRKLLASLPNVEIVFLAEPKHAQINDKLWEEPWDIIFFAGHGETKGDEGRIYINKTDSLTLAEVWYGLRKAVANGLQLAIFNSCDGLGLARCLDDLEIPQMIVMREMVPDFVAQKFLQDFLKNFACGQSLYQAFREAREKLQGLETNFPCASWLPIICQNPAVEPPIWDDLRGRDNLVEQLTVPERYIQNNPIPPQERFTLLSKVIKFNLTFKLVALLLLTCGIFGWRYGMPKLAVVSNDLGFDNYQKGDRVEARYFLELTSILNPNNRVAPYTLGRMCQDVQNFDCARDKYQKSANLGFAAAYSELGRLYIVYYKNYDTAVNLLFQGLEFVKDDHTKYSFLKNLGWVRLEQGRYAEALKYLEDAIKLDSNRASARCLKARVLDSMKETKGAFQEWNNCLILADSKIADEDVWIGMAMEKLNLTKFSKSNEK
jgi:tetratricopeptide (TPR) repeat protein